MKETPLSVDKSGKDNESDQSPPAPPDKEIKVQASTEDISAESKSSPQTDKEESNTSRLMKEIENIVQGMTRGTPTVA